MNPTRLSFEIEDILEAFQLERKINNSTLNHWLQATFELSEWNKLILEQKRQLLQEEGDFWNEEELKMNFLAFLFEAAQLHEKNRFKLFFERPLQANFNGYDLKVVCDALIATPKGIGKPKKPFFFLQEFKKQKNATDPEAQMLTAMLIAQHKNQNQNPIYGAWVQGKYWTFTTLQQKNYNVSISLDASKTKDLYQIIYALKQLKILIIKQLESK